MWFSLVLSAALLTACGSSAASDTPPSASDVSDQAETSQPSSPREIDPSLPMVALTFDDGPHAEYTDQILDILEEHNAVATFFEIGNRLGNAPEAVLRAVDLGCEIGSHSYSHPKFQKISGEEVLAELSSADAAFTEVLGYAPSLLRPPYGSLHEVLDDAGYSIITWSVDPSDWKCKDTDTVVDYIQNFEHLDGQVILLHDVYESTVEAVRILVPWLQEQGFQLVTVSELITLRFGDEVEPNRLYNVYYFRDQVPSPAESQAASPSA